jgi:hypothetical protein
MARGLGQLWVNNGHLMHCETLEAIKRFLEAGSMFAHPMSIPIHGSQSMNPWLHLETSKAALMKKGVV